METLTIKSKTYLYTESGVIGIDLDIEYLRGVMIPTLQIEIQGGDVKVHTYNFNGWKVLYSSGRFLLMDPKGESMEVDSLSNMWFTVNTKDFKDLEKDMRQSMFDLMMDGLILN
jgi:hypothetical protein